MKKIFHRDGFISERRFFWASVFLLSVTGVIGLRLWYLQVFRGDYYRRVSENNRIRRIDMPSPRGLIYDRNGQVVLANTISSDLIYVPQFVKDHDTTLNIISRLLHVSKDSLVRKYNASRGQQKFLPITLMRNLSAHEVSIIESNKVFLPGIDIRVAPRRKYLPGMSAHVLGYLGEISPNELKEFNESHADEVETIDLHQAGDLVGKHGLEGKWEQYLRGRRGYRLIQVDAFGRQSHMFNADHWELPEVPAVPGSNLILTVDIELQKTLNEAFAGKTGSVVVIDPRNGEVLALSSSPEFDPISYQDGLSHEEWQALRSDPLNPLLDKTTGGQYSPGSVYKAVVALAALEEKVISPATTHYCPGYFNLGNQTFRCAHKTAHGHMDLQHALMKSCDVYFYQVGVELGVDRIAKYAKMLGLGRTYGFDLNMELPGLIPTSLWKLSKHKEPWSSGDTPPVAIGQGYNLMTPLQMANLYAAIASKGKIYKPFLVKNVVNYLGENLRENKPELLDTIKEIKPESFDIVRRGLEAVVMDDQGTGKKARVPGVRVAGKTGSVQVVNLKKNNNQKDVSIKWREHAMFASFAPSENPEIVVAVVSEHDEISGGGASAAPVAGAILKRYFELKELRAKTTARVEVNPWKVP